MILIYLCVFNVSIHTLTRRVTKVSNIETVTIPVSIHTLTRRVTFIFFTYKSYKGFNPHPHAEGDNNSVLELVITSVSIHTLTRRVTLMCADANKGAIGFNPHPHAEGDMLKLLKMLK